MILHQDKIIKRWPIHSLKFISNETPRRRAAGYPNGIILLYRTKVRGIRPGDPSTITSTSSFRLAKSNYITLWIVKSLFD
jgi:hypothetical protein